MATFTEQTPQWIERIPQWVEGEADTHWMECGWAELDWVSGDEVCPPLAKQWVECGWAENGWIEGDTVCPVNVVKHKGTSKRGRRPDDEIILLAMSFLNSYYSMERRS